MKLRIFGASAIAAMMLTAVPAMAATVVLDDFNDAQSAIDKPYSGSTSSNSIPYMTGTRTLTAEVTTFGSGDPQATTTLESGGGALSFSNKDGATGKGTLTYTNLGNIVLGAVPFFFFDVGVFDNVADFAVSVLDGSGGTSTYQEVLQTGFSPTLYFSQFTGSADFTDVAELSFMIDTTNVPEFGAVTSVDGSLDRITISAVPVPASGLLLVTALGGVVALRRRKARKAA